MSNYGTGRLRQARMFLVGVLIVLGTLSYGAVGALACPSGPMSGHHEHVTPPPPPPPPPAGF